ncbi:hypothetical protein KY5_3468c [Streptomyces formicae]|uniref:Uncharacterized protein n=1 Tax=Streptomyces formicae TaxID=1616117 RepID=A0A291QAD5_9ACTN|nr:hypothetical protein KY5_3468c [Streptomyces formicae]
MGIGMGTGMGLDTIRMDIGREGKPFIYSPPAA